MAKFNIVGFGDVEKQLLRREQAAAEAAPEMLKAGAKVLIKAQRDSINRMARDKGTLANSITATSVRSGEAGSYVDVYPKGNQPHGTPRRGKKGHVSNAQVGFMLEYGSSTMTPVPWMTEANERSHETVHKAMREVWEEKQGG